MKININSSQPKYENYKDSGVEWLGEIPEHWEVKPGFTIIQERKEKNVGLQEKTVLSLSYGNVIVKSEEKLTGLVPESFETYQLVYPNDIIIRPTDLQNDKTSLRTGLAKDKGIITSAYIDLNVKHNYSSSFYYYFLHSIDITKVIYGLGSGLRQNLDFRDFKRFNFPLPPLQEQTTIASFIDQKTVKIDQAIAQKVKLIELLKERRQILIHNAVTKGLNFDENSLNFDLNDDGKTMILNQSLSQNQKKSKFRPSGVEWIGEIPEHWEVKRLKYVADINKDSLPENCSKNFSFRYVDIGSVTLEEGVIGTEEFIFKDAPSRARRKARVGDTIISTVRTYLKAIDFIDETKSEFIYSTGFAVLEPKAYMYPEYLAYSVRSDSFTNQVTASSKGMSYPAINSSELGILFVVHGGIEEQKEIVKFIKSTNHKIATAISCKEKEIEKLKEYKATLINSAVTGKIKVSHDA